MAAMECTRAFFRTSRPKVVAKPRKPSSTWIRTIATETTTNTTPDVADDIVLDSSLPIALSSESVTSYDPLKASRARRKQLPPSRYQFRPPRYDRGPLHPHQPPRASDPASREFVPGPFSTPRVETAYHNVVAADLMTLCYQHTPPGFRPPQKGLRLRDWDDSSPYHKNRQLRGPRGGDVLRLLRKPITFRNIPMIERITLHSYIKNAPKTSAYLHTAGMALQAISNVKVVTHKAKTSEASWGIIKGKHTTALTVDLKGENMYHFLGKLVNIVLPRVKDWRGIRATSGDDSGNITFGFEPEVVGAFPEIEINYDSYPPKMIPGIHITIHTTAHTDKDARLLLQAIGIPFYGKIVD